MLLPASKLVELQDLVTQFCKHVRASKQQLQQLAGKLNWACCVVYGSCTFLWCILDSMKMLVKPSAQCKFTTDFHAGKHLKASICLSQQPVEVATDACPMAVSAVFSGDWLHYNVDMQRRQC